ncbi:tRNA (adenosine(37)-N6)-threonylcarbamoyltransferase complex ATPase subunit type 1 TsaE [Pseudooctadecabacter jejudonensis]|uniref:tRNA threonylcarbamoyladenosine biosynthesis protein TsaE n=1 Tax=Pseudooctadecabacter jejudonensis TaxID=1391910 RepID=A0A1Y5S5Z5_9RHOB|nr:tRNA (adenosine(37)-N6)-threonylcarbamoyltransferase complex ATPase subunit type 1 TsaE [Pseudooctadecabacter jejudonensis]SLN33284.1 tRNA threonylcarbamoyladenosine biosynthesis protein TsaE [Pseudooctadecabacter jejudonensis]
MTLQTLDIPLCDAAATDALGERLSAAAQIGDCILLKGQIGAGKSALARAFIRARLGPDTEVPSPTFTLVQTYETADGDIWHADLYRLGDTQEAVELGLTEAFDTAITLIEWPDILGEMTPTDALIVELSVREDDHLAHLVFSDRWAQRIQQIANDA